MPYKLNPEAFSPGDYIREEIDARGWTQADLATILGRDSKDVNELINAKRAVTPDTAKQLAEAFGTSAELWMNLESSYQLSRATQANSGVAHRAKIYSIAPISYMQRRGWIEPTENPEILEAQVCKFFNIGSIDESIRFQYPARRPGSLALNQFQLAWLYRARHLALAAPVTNTFSARTLELALVELSKLKANPEDLRRIPKVLSEAGIRFIIIEPLPRTKTDGACFWLDRKSPVVVLSMRYDRIDWFWHTLIHELAHVKNGDGMEEPTVDSQLVGDDAQPNDEKHEGEKRADEFAASFLVDPHALQGFIDRVAPLYSHIKIMNFAQKRGVHPGIVVGQLQRRQEIKYAHSRRMLVRVRGLVTPSALTDGWRHMAGL